MAKKDARSPEHDRPTWRDRMEGLRQKNRNEFNLTSEDLRQRAQAEVDMTNWRYRNEKRRAEGQARDEGARLAKEKADRDAINRHAQEQAELIRKAQNFRP